MPAGSAVPPVACGMACPAWGSDWQCPIAACSGGHCGSLGAGAGADDVAALQWPIAACSGGQAASGAGAAGIAMP
ncbi:hypothetical protein [Sphingomonas sp.]|uniref:hypothetical protein n=1 Tax=Sphingomonas sp. TaxID=28214 RepID=UPI0025E1A3B7|nr:hypothetical protein [Sphingomonas sp.]